ncbi:MAG: DUF2752 domain-containing protein, partial [Agathobaculum butyriciproducens]
MPERFRRGLNGLLVLLILGALAYASALLFGWNCPIKYLTGVPCPGCGLSRALAALLRLDFRTALRFHPMVFVLPPVVLYALFGKKPLFGSKNLERVLLWSVIVLDIAIWLIRLALHDPFCQTARTKRPAAARKPSGETAVPYESPVGAERQVRGSVRS